MLRNKQFLLIAFFFIAIIAVGVWSYQNTRSSLGYIDLKRVIEGFNLKKELQRKYSGLLESKKKYIDSLGLQLQNMEVELSSSAKVDTNKTNNFLLKRKHYFDIVKSYDEEYKSTNATFDQQVNSQLNQYIKEYGEEKGYDLIFGSMGDGHLMHGKKDLDLTDQVIEYINVKYSGVK